MRNKVLIDCTNMVHSKVGGFETYLFNLLDHFRDRANIDFTLFVLKSEQHHFAKFDKDFIIRGVDLKNNFIRLIWFNCILPLKSINYNLILFPANFRPLFIPNKTITVIHDLQYLALPDNWSPISFYFRKLFIPISIKKSTTLIAISYSTKQEIIKNFKVSNLHVIYNPVSITPQLSSNNTDRTKKYFLIPSSLALHKNISNLIKAIDSYEFENYDFIFIGSYDKNNFQHSYRSSNIFVLGFVDEIKKHQLFQNAYGIILPSIYEGFGMPYIEAVLHKKNIISSDIVTAREILKNNAFFISKPYGSDEIKSAIKNFLSENKDLITENMYSEIKIKTDPYSIASAYINLINRTINK
jgi:hypothetical protein